MARSLGDAQRARELARLFEAWRRAFDRQDIEAMAAARRAIDATAAGRPPRAANLLTSPSGSATCYKSID
jgi:hypothetical protein